jgi:ferredoxin
MSDVTWVDEAKAAIDNINADSKSEKSDKISAMIELHDYVAEYMASLRDDVELCDNCGEPLTSCEAGDEDACYGVDPSDIAHIASGFYDPDSQRFDEFNGVKKAVSVAIELYREAERQLTEENDDGESAEAGH